MIKDITRRMGEHLAAYPGPWLTCFIGLLALPFFTGHIPIVRFTEEEITVTVHSRSIAVDAAYHYHNPFPFPVSQSYSLPFPEDENHAPPTRIELMQFLPEEKPIPVNHSLGKYRFSVYFPASAEVKIHLFYEQTTPRGRGTYILTTTQPWGHPLEKAAYRLIPKGVRITDSNYPLTTDHPGEYRWIREKFMPPADWHFTWKEEKI
jgi:hypothetical protein